MLSSLRKRSLQARTLTLQSKKLNIAKETKIIKFVAKADQEIKTCPSAKADGNSKRNKEY